MAQSAGRWSSSACRRLAQASVSWFLPPTSTPRLVPAIPRTSTRAISNATRPAAAAAATGDDAAPALVTPRLVRVRHFSLPVSPAIAGVCISSSTLGRPSEGTTSFRKTSSSRSPWHADASGFAVATAPHVRRISNGTGTFARSHSSQHPFMKFSPVLPRARRAHPQWCCSQTRCFSSWPISGVRRYVRSEFGLPYTYPYLSPYDYHVPLVEIVPDDVPIVGEINPVTPQINLKEEAKPYCHGIILDIDSLNRQGYSLLEPLTPDNVLVDGHGRLCLMDGVLIKPKTATSTATDFIHTSSTMKTLLLRTARPKDIHLSLSPEFLDLCDDLENPSLLKAYPQIYHSSLLPLHLRGKAYLDLYDYVFFVCPRTVTKFVTKDAPYRQNWKEIADGNKVIRPYFDIKKLNLRSDRQFLGFWRVIRCHVFIHRDRVYFSIDALERIVQFKTPLLMPNLCKRLWTADRRLANIMLHRHFLYPIIRPHPDHLIQRRASSLF